jgi:tetratricopeptide (TPR) repeat protein
MTDPIFERYKDALRAGHLAALKSEYEAALLHYRRAAAIADERALPHTSMGNVLLRLGRAEEAENAYERALERAPHDDAGLAGLAEARAARGQTGDACGALDRLADLRVANGRLSDAIAALRRAEELAPSGARGARILDLERDVAMAAGDIAAVTKESGEAWPVVEHEVGGLPAGRDEGTAPEPALPDWREPVTPVSEQPAAPPSDTPHRPPASAGVALARAAARMQAAVLAEDAGDRAGAVGAYLEAADAYATADAVDAGLDACGRALDLAPTSAAVHRTLARLYRARGWEDRADDKLRLIEALRRAGGVDSDLDASLAAVSPSQGVDPELRFSAAEVAVDNGDRETAVWGFLQAAEAYAAADAVDAALDACQRALAVAPDSSAAHLALARLYARRGWHEQAVRKLDLLEELVVLGGDEAGRREIAALASEVRSTS